MNSLTKKNLEPGSDLDEVPVVLGQNFGLPKPPIPLVNLEAHINGQISYCLTPSTNHELWHQTQSCRIPEEILFISNTPGIYKVFVGLLHPQAKDQWLVGDNQINPQALLTQVPSNMRSIFAAALNIPGFTSEIIRRTKILEDMLFTNRHAPPLFETPNTEGLNKEIFTKILARIKKLVDQGGPQDKAQQEEFLKLCQGIEATIEARQLCPDQFMQIIAEFGMAFSPMSLMGQSLWRPRGYAGTFDMMEAIYNFQISDEQDIAGDYRVKNWNQTLLSTTSAEDVAQRRYTIIDDLLRDRAVELAQEKPLKVLNFASGPARLEADLIKQMQIANLNPEHLDWRSVDGDPDAVGFAQNRLAQHPNFRIEECNIIREIGNRKTTANYDEILTVGLLDYFDDKFTAKALKHFYRMLKPSGSFRIGQFNTDHNEAAFLRITNWYLFRRNETDMFRLCEEAEIPASKVNIKRISANGPQLIITAHK